MSTSPSPPIDLYMVGIRLGDELVWWDDPSTTCMVTQLYPTEVKFKGELMSLSAAAGAVVGYSVSGPQFWCFEGQSIDQRRATFREWHQR